MSLFLHCKQADVFRAHINRTFGSCSAFYTPSFFLVVVEVDFKN